MVIGIIIVFILLIFVFIYNSFIYKENQVNNVFATVDSLLQKRYDLISSLVSTVKAYAAHEKEVFEKISELRNSALSQNVSTNQKVDIDNQMEPLLKSIFAISESYPELKASENFLDLQRTLTEVEDQISAGRRAYNASVTDYNNSVQMFPTNIIASIFGFKLRTLFQIEAGKSESKDWFNNAE